MRGSAAVAALFALSACASEGAAPQVRRATLADSVGNYVPGATWRTGRASDAGFNEASLAALDNEVANGRFGSVHGIVVVRYGYIIHEQYLQWSAEQAHTMQSVTKSVTSLLFGLAGGNDDAALNRPVVDVFRKYSDVANLDDQKRALTMRHLLTMRTSMDFWEQPYPGAPLDQLNRSQGDWIKFILDRKMIGMPGTTWAYNSGAAILTGGAIREMTGENVDVFARRTLFAPLGISGESWAKSPFDGLPHTGGGLYLRPRDLARIGYLVLRNGKWGTQQLVPSSWIAKSTAVDTRDNSLIFSSYRPGYGYFWWLFPTTRNGNEIGIIAASGSGGQWLFVVPSLDLVVVMVAENGNGLDFLYDRLLPAITGR